MGRRATRARAGPGSTDDPVQSDALVRNGLARAREAGDQLAIVDGLELLADVAQARGDDAMAVRLWAGASSARAALDHARAAKDGRPPPTTPRARPSGSAPSGWAPCGRREALAVDAALAYMTRRHGRQRRPDRVVRPDPPSSRWPPRRRAPHQPRDRATACCFRATVKTHLLRTSSPSSGSAVSLSSPRRPCVEGWLTRESTRSRGCHGGGVELREAETRSRSRRCTGLPPISR